MSLLKKAISLREQAHPDHEKPFLEHLEDLRDMIIRIVITLLISMIICFAFNKQLLDILRHPVQKVWTTHQQKSLPGKKDDAPKAVTVEQWQKAKEIEQAASKLSDADREAFYASLGDDELAFHVRCVTLLRAAKALPDDKQEDFIRKLKLDQELTKQVLALIELEPGTEIDARGNLSIMSSFNPTETFMLTMKLSFFAGIVLAFPFLLYFILQFVLPGLHANERKALWPALAIGFGLFLSGVAFAYFQVLPRALMFFYEWGGGLEISNDWRIGWYISFATTFVLLFGLAFELPVVVMVFVKLGLLTYDIMASTRRYAIVFIFILAAIITPTPDVITLTLMAGPMYILYEICIWLAWFDRKKQRERDAQEAKEHEEWLERKAKERREAAEKGEQEDTTLAGDPYHDDYQDPYREDQYERDHLDHDVHEYDPYHDDHPEDYNWDEEYDQFHHDADHDGSEEDESALDEEVGESKKDSDKDAKKDSKEESKAEEESDKDSKDDDKPKSDS